MTSLCDQCFAPGACCRRIGFYADGEEAAFWLDEPIEPQIRSRMHAEDINRPMPFRIHEIIGRWHADEGREYGRIEFSCANLLSDGRCGDYEGRPWLCRVFEPAGDVLCVHWRGAEGGE